MEYRIPESVTVVQSTAPRKDVRTVFVHSGVTEIADDAFRGWTALAEVVFAKGSKLERIGAHAFAGTALERFVAPRSLKTIRAGTFMNCNNLKEVRLNEGLESIGGEGDGVFLNSGIERLYIPSTLREMSTLLKCKGLKKVEVARGCTVNVKRNVWFTVSVDTVDPEEQTPEPVLPVEPR